MTEKERERERHGGAILLVRWNVRVFCVFERGSVRKVEEDSCWESGHGRVAKSAEDAEDKTKFKVINSSVNMLVCHFMELRL